MSFDQYALQWDTEKRIKRAQVVADEIGKRLKQPRYENALEFGCGTGLISFALIDRLEEITMVDTSKEMLDIVMQKAEHYPKTSIMPLQVDLIQTKLKTTYDVIYSSMSLHHVLELEKMMTQFYDLLKESGEICIVDIDKEDGRFHANYPEFDGHNGFDHEWLKALMTQVGFKNVTIQTFYHDTKHHENACIPYSLFCASGVKV